MAKPAASGPSPFDEAVNLLRPENYNSDSAGKVSGLIGKLPSTSPQRCMLEQSHRVRMAMAGLGEQPSLASLEELTLTYGDGKGLKSVDDAKPRIEAYQRTLAEKANELIAGQSRDYGAYAVFVVSGNDLRFVGCYDAGKAKQAVPELKKGEYAVYFKAEYVAYTEFPLPCAGRPPVKPVQQGFLNELKPYPGDEAAEKIGTARAKSKVRYSAFAALLKKDDTHNSFATGEFEQLNPSGLQVLKWWGRVIAYSRTTEP